MERYYDPTGDVLYVYLRTRQPGERYTTRSVMPGVSLDLDERQQPVGLEILWASERYPASDLIPYEGRLGQEISLAHAAALANLSPRTLKAQAQAGKLKARKFGPLWVTTEAWLREYLETRAGRPGRKPKRPVSG